MSKAVSLASLLQTLFNRSELQGFLGKIGAKDITQHVRSGGSDADFSTDVAEALDRRGLINQKLYEELCTARPGRVPDIDTWWSSHGGTAHAGRCTHHLAGFDAARYSANVRAHGHAALLIDDSPRTCRQIAWAYYGQPELPDCWWHVQDVATAQVAVSALAKLLTDHPDWPWVVVLDRRLPPERDRHPVDAEEILAKGPDFDPSYASFSLLYATLRDLPRREIVGGKSRVYGISGFRPPPHDASARSFVTWHSSDLEGLRAVFANETPTFLLNAALLCRFNRP